MVNPSIDGSSHNPFISTSTVTSGHQENAHSGSQDLEHCDAMELTCDQLYFLASQLSVSLPWVLAIVPPYTSSEAKKRYEDSMKKQLQNLQILDEKGQIHPLVVSWVRALAGEDGRLELRCMRKSDMLRGAIVPMDNSMVVVFRNSQLVALSVLRIYDTQSLVPSLLAGFPEGREPAQFKSFSFHVSPQMPEGMDISQVQSGEFDVRGGKGIDFVMRKLGIAQEHFPLVRSIMTQQFPQVDVIAFSGTDYKEGRSEVGFSIIDTAQGLVLVKPIKNPSSPDENKWDSYCTSGTTSAIASAVSELLGLMGKKWLSA